MTTLGKLFRTTAFKLALAYSVVFAVTAMFVFAGVGYNVRRVVDDQIAQTVDADIRGLADQYGQGGIRQLVGSIERRLQRPGDDIYLVTTFNGDALAGNVANLPAIVSSDAELTEITYQRTGDNAARRRALARVFVLPGGFRLLVGHDIEERETLQNVFKGVLSTSLVWLVVVGVAGGLFMARRVLNRVDAMADSARAIMNGNLAGRLPLNGSGDELDRLAESLNAMLARITDLMAGLRDVSDNIAHDLRTPLTRLRNKAEHALRGETDAHALRAALETVIDEADGMIRIFDALLMIARAEAGSGAAFERIDAGAIARDVGELYEAAAEDQGLRLRLQAEPGLWVQGSRELVGQALANLIDNALKYGRPAAGDVEPEIALAAGRRDGRVELIVADRGPGIAASDRPRVVKRFVRLEEARSRPGSGLGLSLASAVAHLHGGELRLEDNRPGLRVVLAVPAAPLAPPRALPAPPAREPALQA